MSAPLDPRAYRAGPYGFRPMSRDDFPLVRPWLGAPEVTRWWGDAEEEIGLLMEDLDDPRMTMWLVSHDERPFAYI